MKHAVTNSHESFFGIHFFIARRYLGSLEALKNSLA